MWISMPTLFWGTAGTIGQGKLGVGICAWFGEAAGAHMSTSVSLLRSIHPSSGPQKRCAQLILQKKR